MSSDLDKLDAQITELQKKRQAILDAEWNLKLNEVKAIVQQFGFTVTDLGLAAGSRKRASTAPKTKPEAKYVNPKDSTQTWHGGKGPKPKWVKEYLEKGGKLEAIHIK